MKSLSSIYKCLIFTCFPVVSSLSSPAATYIEPDLSKELFKLEKIPLQVDSMKELSKHLVVIAKRQHGGNAVQQRTTAQLLALAARLDPSNQEVRNINRSLSGQKIPEHADENSLNKAKARIRFFKRWLANPDAGSNANLLADYLVDATKALSPNTAGNKDLGDWKQTIPPLAKFSQGTPPDRRNEREPDVVDKPENHGNTVDTPPTGNKMLHIANLSVKTPCTLENWKKYRDVKSGKEKSRLVVTRALSEIKIKIRSCDKKETKRLEINHISTKYGRKDSHKDSLFQGVAAALYEMVISRHAGLGHYKSEVTISGGTYSRSNGLLLTGALAVMLEASATNNPLRSDLHIFADVDGKGKFRMSENFWLGLETLRKNNTGGRLIVPKEASKLLTNVLAFGEPDFFTRWEVFAVDTLDQAMAVSAKTTTDELTKANELFGSIQNLAKKSAVTKIAANSQVRSRLSEIASLSPNHMSARALLLQGSSKRPRYLSPEALAHVLMPTISAMHNTMIHGNASHPSSDTMKTAHADARKSLDPLEHLVDRSENELYVSTLGLANDFRSLSLLIRRARDRDSSNDVARRKIQPQYTRMTIHAEELLKQARKSAGLADPEQEEPEE